MNLDVKKRYLDQAERALPSSNGGSRQSETSFLQGLLRELGHGAPAGLSPAGLFRAALRNGPLMRSAQDLLRVLAGPSQRPQDALRAGDWMLRAVPGTGDVGHVSVLASDDLLTHSMLAAEGIAAESTRPGYYGLVIEAGAFPHSRVRPFARRLLDSRGRVPPNTVFLRPEVFPSGAAIPTPEVALPVGQGGWGDIEASPPVTLPPARPTTVARVGFQPDVSVLCPPPPVILDQFDFDADRPKAAHRTRIGTLAQEIVDSQTSSDPIHTLCILGHTDNVGGEAYNQDLGARRAIAVANELEAALETRRPGLAATLGRTVESRGEEAPLVPNTSAANRARNRRVEIFLNRRWLGVRGSLVVLVSNQSTGQPIPRANVTLAGIESRAAQTDGFGKAFFEQLIPGEYTVSASKEGFKDASTEIIHPSDQVQTASFVGQSALGVPRPIHLRLRRVLHRFTPQRWFLSPLVRPITHNNQVKVYVRNTGDVWADMRHAIERATDSGLHFIYLTGWQLGLDTEMGTKGSPTLRKLLEAADNRNIQVRALLYKRQFLPNWNKGEVDFINGLKGGQAFLDDRYLVAGSHHQKLLLVNSSDGLVGFCGSSDIHPFRRDWHEVHCRVRGPAARDLHDVFAERWNDFSSGLVQKRKRPLMALTSLSVRPGAGTADVQVVRTYGNGSAHRGIDVNPITTDPEGYKFAPRGEQTIYDLIENAIEQAEVYIYLEDQYLTCCEDMKHGVAMSKLLAKKLKAAKEGHSSLQKLIILVNRTCNVNGEIRQAWQRRKKFLDALRAEDDPANPHLVVAQYKAKHNIFFHSKTWIFDDELAIISSANCNRRGYSHDSEVGVGIIDTIPPDPTGEQKSLPQKIRMDLWHKHLSPAPQASMTDVSPPGLGLDRRTLSNPTRVFHLWENLDPAGKLEHYNDAPSEVNKCPDGDLKQGDWFWEFARLVPGTGNLPTSVQWDSFIDPDGS